MTRFFRSAAFPILIVIVLAFFAQQLINPGEREDTPNWSEFKTQLDANPEQIEAVTLEQKTDTIKVEPREGSEYSTGYPSEAEQSLINTLERQKVDTNIEGTGGGGILSVLTYILPFLLFL